MSNLVIFKAISNFVIELYDLYGSNKKYHALKLYKFLLSKTKISDDSPINKHIEAFKIFCASNKEALLSRDLTKITNKSITYSSRVYIDIYNIFKVSDEETRNAIWDHLLNIYSLCEPNDKEAKDAKEILKNKINSSQSSPSSFFSGESKENNLLSGIFSKLENSGIDPTKNSPLEAITSLMSSGVFTDILGTLTGGLKNGEFDIKNLLNGMHGLINQLDEKSNQECNTTQQSTSSQSCSTSGSTQSTQHSQVCEANITCCDTSSISQNNNTSPQQENTSESCVISIADQLD